MVRSLKLPSDIFSDYGYVRNEINTGEDFLSKDLENIKSEEIWTQIIILVNLLGSTVHFL